jgi:hypothetical protein
MKRQGSKGKMVDAMFHTLENMETCVQTTYGDSDITYKAEGVKSHGIIQGNGAGPTIWSMTSLPMLDSLQDKGFA